MRILGVHAMDHYGVGGALRGQEMGYALRKLGHEIIQISPGKGVFEMLRSKRPPEGVILTGTWHQLMAGTTNAVLIAEACDDIGIPCIWWYGSNGSIFGCVDPDPAKRAASLQRTIDLICERLFIGVICPYSMGIYRRYGVPDDKMKLIPSVFDGDLFCPSQTEYDETVSARLRYKFGIPDKAFCLGTIGNTPNSKGGDEVIQAVALLKGEMPDLHYIILHTPAANLSGVKAKSPDGLIEGNSERDVLQMSKDLATKLKVANRVHFLGLRFPRVSMPTFYRLLDVYCSPSKAENLGQPLVESQLCGLPLVTFRGFSFDFCTCPTTGQQIEPSGTVEDAYGLVIPQADPEDVANAIRAARAVSGPALAGVTRDWTYQRFHHHNAQTMVDSLHTYRAMLTGQAQARVGDQGDAMTTGYVAAAERIELEIGGKPTGSVLDIGCNSGAGMQELIRRWPDAKVFGVEPVSKFVASARNRGLTVKIGEAEKLPFVDNHFMFVFCRHSLEHARNLADAVAEIKRVLRPGGHVYVQAPIEPAGSTNTLHTSAFTTPEAVRGMFPGLTEVYWGPQETVAELLVQKPL